MLGVCCIVSCQQYNIHMRNDALAFVHLLQLADSALPVGAVAHSFGLETLVAEEELDVDGLEAFLRAYLAEAGALECSFCLLAYDLAAQCTEKRLYEDVACWQSLNARLSAFKTARESRQASVALGRRLLQLAQGWQIYHPLLPDVVRMGQANGSETHYSCVFGLLGALLGVERASTGLAYLQQFLSGQVSVCQRLLPLGQSRSSAILWRLHTDVLATLERCATIASADDICCFTTLVDLGSMRHPTVTTRLFIS